ncbi:TonB-dependent receptor plug domain-containing protein [Arenicella xantha]|uniref:Iron complex outermembrane receptor protein n=1 Tax=Arenicella xantha TaxID=644221 RepID=A0A395JIA3_9GAMM|nr:TonB-dependent receptor [Arenicella xantha]RBP49755.1 iron complex outermembrane receptor protein [Arenicella xantha]
MRKFQPRALALAIAVASVGTVSTPSFAQQEGAIEEIVTIGTRGKPRSATDSVAAVDVISGSDFTSQGGVDTANLLRNVVPSFNVNDQPISDAATLVRPANLRGLAPDHTLVLVNGQRRHRAAVISWLGNGLSDGSQGPDIAAIPALALQSVEVLRDGAAAQYGSDAIAGVINFNLKNSDSEGSLEVRYGQYTEGENSYSVAVNQGFAIGDGFLNLTAEFAEAEATDRSVQRSDAQDLINAGYQGVNDPAQVWGSPEVDGDIKLWANFGTQVTESIEFFGNANYNTKEVTGGFYYRNPTNRGGVYGDGAELLIGDLTPNDGVGCPTVTLNGVTPDPVAYAQVQADPNCFSFQETIPGGFTPNFGGEVTDTSLLLGLRGETDGGMFWSVSGYYGKNEADFFINNTVNASLGPNSPRDFNPGAYEQADLNLNVDFSMPLSDNVSLAFGAEYRNEEFSIIAGQEESYIDGGLGTQGFSTSSNGFPGFSPSIAGAFDRANTSIYTDLEWQATDSLLVAAAVRYEDFDDFGSTTNYKLGANYTITDNFGMRATVSTGFKAPTPGQSNASNISTQIIQGVLTNQGVIPPNSPAAQLRGGGALDPEDSTNLTLGAYMSAGPVDITVDYFDIDVENRLSLSNDFALTAEDLATLAGQGIDASDISQFRFFTNQFDTNTSGYDIVATWNTDWLNGSTTWNLAFNYTDTEVTRRNPTLLNDNRVNLIENGVPDTRWNFTANHQMEKVRLLARFSYYGEFYDNEAGGEFDDNILLDLEAGYNFSDALTFTIGARNVTDEQGCSTNVCGGTPANALGLPYSQFSPFGFNGTFLYGRATYNF